MATSKFMTLDWQARAFNDHIDEFIRLSKKDSVLVLRKFMFDLMRKVIKRTPVDTGRARAGWSAAGDALGIVVTRPRNHKPEDTAYSEVKTVDFIMLRATNNVEYIMPLEFGHSAQHPFGMVRISMAEMRTGQALEKELNLFYKKKWSNLTDVKRYRTQRLVLTDVFRRDKNLRNLPLPPRRSR
jgi:hypothetical protein